MPHTTHKDMDTTDAFIHKINTSVTTQQNQSTNPHTTYIIQLARFEREYALPTQTIKLVEPDEPDDMHLPPLTEDHNDIDYDDLPPIDGVGDYITSV